MSVAVGELRVYGGGDADGDADNRPSLRGRDGSAGGAFVRAVNALAQADAAGVRAGGGWIILEIGSLV